LLEPDTPTAVSLDAIEHLVETRLLGQALQLGGEILLERLAAPLSPPLKRSVDIGWEITNENVCHAYIMISYWVRGQAVSRDEDEQTTTELARVRIATTQQLSRPAVELGSVEGVVEGPTLLLVADPAVIHVGPFEHGDVQLPADGIAGLVVGLATASGEGGGELQALRPPSGDDGEIDETIFGRREVGADAGLLDFRGETVDGAAVVGVEQLTPFGLGSDDPAGRQLTAGRIGAWASDHLGLESLAQAFARRAWWANGPIEPFNLDFELVDGEGALLAARAVAAVLLAEEIAVELPVSCPT
jgi:hypothetical protein